MKKYFIVTYTDQLGGFHYMVFFTIAHAIKMFREVETSVSLHVIEGTSYQDAVNTANYLISKFNS